MTTLKLGFAALLLLMSLSCGDQTSDKIKPLSWDIVTRTRLPNGFASGISVTQNQLALTLVNQPTASKNVDVVLYDISSTPRLSDTVNTPCVSGFFRQAIDSNQLYIPCNRKGTSTPLSVQQIDLTQKKLGERKNIAGAIQNVTAIAVSEKTVIAGDFGGTLARYSQNTTTDAKKTTPCGSLVVLDLIATKTALFMLCGKYQAASNSIGASELHVVTLQTGESTKKITLSDGASMMALVNDSLWITNANDKIVTIVDTQTTIINTQDIPFIGKHIASNGTYVVISEKSEPKTEENVVPAGKNMIVMDVATREILKAQTMEIEEIDVGPISAVMIGQGTDPYIWIATGAIGQTPEIVGDLIRMNPVVKE